MEGEESRDEKLETIFGSDEAVHRRGFLSYLFFFFLSFLIGILSTYVSLMYIYPFVLVNQINIPIPNYSTDIGFDKLYSSISGIKYPLKPTASELFS